MDTPHAPTATPDALDALDLDDDADDLEGLADDDEDDGLDEPAEQLAAPSPPPADIDRWTLAELYAERDRRGLGVAAPQPRREAAARRPRPKTDARPRCGARCRSAGGRPCVAPAVWLAGASKPRNGRCRMHGGLSTGPRTAEGRARVVAASRAANAARAAARRESITGARGATDETDETPATPSPAPTSAR